MVQVSLIQGKRNTRILLGLLVFFLAISQSILVHSTAQAKDLTKASPTTVNVTASLTVDNVYQLCFGDATTVSVCVGSDNVWKTAEQYDLTLNSVTDYIYIAAWSDKKVAQGLLAELTANGKTVRSGDPTMEVCATGHNLNYNDPAPGAIGITAELKPCQAKWAMPTVGETNGVNPWGTINGISAQAHWVWYDSLKECKNGYPTTPSEPITMTVSSRDMAKGDSDYAKQSPDQLGSPFTPGCNHEEYLIFRLPASVFLPDLVVQNVKFDQACNATFTITNIGNTDVADGVSFIYEVSPLYTINGQTVPPSVLGGWNSGVPAGQSVTPFWPVVITYNSTTITAIVDLQDDVVESNEGNNQGQFPVPMRCQSWDR